MHKIELMRNGYDPFLDFIKGFCIVSVILNHSVGPYLRDYALFYFWGEIAVPLFLLLQSYHVFRKEKISLGKQQFVKMFHRILLPCIIISLVGFVILIIFKHISLYEMCRRILLGGGIGYRAGTYYVWVYLQFFLLLPLTYWAFRRFNVNLLTGGYICNY